MHLISYASTSHKLLTEIELEQLLVKSRDNNIEHNITGLLLYRDGSFIQVIEGPESELRQLYRNINSDPLHYNVTTILDEPTAGRIFPSWHMGYARMQKTPDIEGFNRILQDALILREFSEDASDAKHLLATFAK